MTVEAATRVSSPLVPLLSGGFAGLAVDVTLFPLDTIKTRLQSAPGFKNSGGFSGIYRGLGAVVAGSVPTAALFFFSYEMFKSTVGPMVHEKYTPLVYLAAASVGEVMACFIRVPTEIAKQRQQAIIGLQTNKGGFQILCEAYRNEGFTRGLYRGYFSTVLRDLPFSFIQFPIWEYLKKAVAENSVNGEITSFEVAMCGSLSGAIAGALTTPLDVTKTRIMLAEKQTASKKLRISTMMRSIYHEAGVRGLCAGLSTRIISFTLGGAVFFGAYDYSKNFVNSFMQLG
ncbi:S-adenosylmethionine mitochondrial carrier protein homolog isoform X2 [Arctopsyche grandis]|uniref:S-adenosylmethionine mitochondrial carrier protein homolog isoform X2 n=1 Tax=Arctopsyche grandis TaxID=121162 RepID=UPI00406D9632